MSIIDLMRNRSIQSVRLGRVVFPLTLATMLVGVGCGGGEDPTPRPDLGGARDLGFRDAGVPDMSTSDMSVPTDGGVVDQGTSDQGTSDLGTSDQGTTDMGTGTTDMGVRDDTYPRITLIDWTFPQGACNTSDYNVTVAMLVADSDNGVGGMTLEITNAPGCVIGPTQVGSNNLTVALMFCSAGGGVSPTITVTDPDDKSDTVSGFTIVPCTDGQYTP